MRIVVLGARGQLGAAVVHECRLAHETIGFGRTELDVTDDTAVARAIAALEPDVVINCSGYNDVDGAEDRPVDALNANAFAVRALARAAAAGNSTLVQYSSDFVFDGTASAPYAETERPNPRSVYAASKLAGEWFATDAPRAYVLRVESLFGRVPGGPESRGTVATMMHRLLAGEEVRAFEDRTVSPTYIRDAARATRRLLELRAPAGLYHCVNSGSCTWFELARELASLMGVEPRIVRVRVTDVKLRAGRPQFCALSNEKLRAAGIPMPSWQDALARSLQDFRRESADEVAHGQA